MTAGPDASGLTDAEAIRSAVASCPDVAALSSGSFGEVASYFAGHRVGGVRVDDQQVEVHVVVRYGAPLRQIANELDGLLAPLLAGRHLHVVVADVLLPGETLDQAGQVESDSDVQ